MISGSAAMEFLSMISDSAVVYLRWRFQRPLYNWIPVMICRSAATQFSSMISYSTVVYVRWHDQKIDVFSQVQECRSNK
jgi:hypothetical protein